MDKARQSYLLSSTPTELERLQLQSRVWEPAGRAFLGRLPDLTGATVLDVGCGAMGWLRVLSEAVGASGTVIGTDIDERMLQAAEAFVNLERLTNVSVEKDDLFASALPDASFDVVHARFQLAPLGRAEAQLATFTRLVKRGGWIILEEPEVGSWRVNGEAPATRKLIESIDEGFRSAGGDFSAGRALPALLAPFCAEQVIDATVLALSHDHPYLRLPLQFASSLRARIEPLVGKAALERLLLESEAELARRDAWGTSFTLIQVAGRRA